MMTPKQMKELFGKTKSVPAGTKKATKTKIQQPSSTNAEQSKKYISASPSGTKRKKCCGR